MTYMVRVATPADLKHIVAHRAGMFRDMGVPTAPHAISKHFADWLAAAMASGDYRAWLVDSEAGEVVAGAGVIVYPWPPGPNAFDGRRACVFNVYTEPAHRNRGLARRLLDVIHAWCGGEGIKNVMLNASPAALPLYEKIGYKVVDQPMMTLTL
jgi:GNAT superfamily N-acetyltransferase